MNTIIKLYTEDKKNLPSLTRKYFDEFTLIKGIGYWDNKQEHTVIIEVLGGDTLWKKMQLLAHEINKKNKQEMCIVVQQHLTDKGKKQKIVK